MNMLEDGSRERSCRQRVQLEIKYET